MHLAARSLQIRLLRVLRSVRAWMLVLPVDALMLLLPIVWAPQLWRATVSTTLLSLVLLTGGGRYRARLHLAVMDEIPALLRNVLSAVAIVAMVVAARHEPEAGMDYLVESIGGLGLLVVGRIVTTAVINASRKHQITRHRTVLVGGGGVAADLVATLDARPRYGLAVVGFVDSGHGVVDPTFANRLGALSQLGQIVRRTRADVVLIADGDLREADVMEAIEGPALESCDVLIVPRMHYLRTRTGQGDHIGSIPVMRLGQANLDGPGLALKRGFDIAVSSLLLVVLSPVLAAFALLIRLSGPTVIFRQPRIGRGGVVFDCLKLRSMRPATTQQSSTSWSGSVSDEDRTTAVGALMRRTSIDELPQLWNVLRGEMSLVGPRPERPYFVEQFAAEYEVYARRHRMRTGLTGMAQVNGLRGDTSIAERARYDNYYIENWSLWLDVKILLGTVSEVLFARGR